MPVTGIVNLYTSFAQDMIKSHVESNTISQISRASIERELIAQLDHASGLDVDYKIAWYHAILQTPLFDSLWYSLSIRHSLPSSASDRYTVATSLYEYSLDGNAALATHSKPAPSKPHSSKRHSTHRTHTSTHRRNPPPTTTSTPAPRAKKAIRYLPPTPAVTGPRASTKRAAAANNIHEPGYPHSDSATSTYSSDMDSETGSTSSTAANFSQDLYSSAGKSDSITSSAARFGQELYQNAIASSSTPGKVVGGASRLGGGVKLTPNQAGKKGLGGKEEEPGDGAFYVGGGGGRKGIDRRAGGGKGKGGKGGKGGEKGGKEGGGKAVKFTGLDGSGDAGGEGKENQMQGKGKRVRVLTEKALALK